MKLSKTLLTGAVLAALSPFRWPRHLPMAASSLPLSGSFATYSAGSLDLTGWTIEEGSVDLINNYWQPSSGDYSLDLSGNGDGVISQAFDTVVGTTYTVSFDMAGNPDDSDKVKTVQVGLSQQPLYTFDTTGRTRTDMGWVTQSFTFTAVATSSTLHFASVQDSAYGVALDNISVTAVPEPETYAMLLAGLGLIGTLARRRKSSSK
ncbi:MAG: choice-of-anchor C family protein [Burkholderiales bacterium]|nr:choice-of-anchor C family protein [Burkholderiales bacterium]